MNRKILYLGLMVLGFGLVLSACNDDDDTPNYTQKETTIAAHSWLLQDEIWTDTTGADSSVYQSCLEDDWIRFSLNHDFTFSDNSTSCDADSIALPYGDGIWAFNFSEDSVALKYSDTTLHWAVENLTDSTLQLSFGDSVDHQFVTRTLKFEPATSE